MASSFDQQIGAEGDVRELEYISALHQTTTEEVRRDASIKAEDIQRFLMSRYGIKVTEDQVRNTILEGMGGGSTQDDVLDLMEVVAMLLIPIFLKAARKDYLCEDESLDDQSVLQESRRTAAKSLRTRWEAQDDGIIPTPPGMIDFVLKMILHDVTGDRKPKRLTKDLIQRILISHGENALAGNEELVNEMYDAATSWDARPKEGVTAGDEEAVVILDAETFATALTQDIQMYDIRNETRLTTNFADVYLTDQDLTEKEEEMFASTTTNEELVRKHRENQALRQKVKMSEQLERVDTMPFIDTTAGTYRSKGILVMLWATILITYFAYSDLTRNLGETCYDELAYVYDSGWSENFDAMVCESFNSVKNWMFFFFGFSAFGVICVFIGSFGNAVDGKETWKPLVSCAFVLLLVFLPWFLVVEEENDREENSVLYLASVVFGLVTCLFCLARAAELYFTQYELDSFRSCFNKFDHPILRSTVSEERSVKQATARKLSQMTRNALKINKLKNPDSIINTHYGQALKSYETESRNPANTVTAGGFCWTWKKLLGKGDDFAKVGIWVPARMISSNLAQYVVAFYLLLGGIYLTNYLGDEYDIEWAKRHFGAYVDRSIGYAANSDLVEEATSNVTAIFGQYLQSADAGGVIDLGCRNNGLGAEEFLESHCANIDGSILCDQSSSDLNYLCPIVADPAGWESLNETSRLALMNASGVSANLISETIWTAAQEATSRSVDTLYPAEKYMVTVPMIVATVIAFISSLSLAITYIPSVTTTILKLRNGHIATLRNKDFNRYRCAPDQVALLTGSLFWGSLFSGVVVGGFIGLIVFFFLWQASVYYAQRAVALLAGIISVALVRLAIVCACRCTLWSSFYRVRPGAANIGILALEWGNFAISAGYILARSIKLLLAAMTFIGRIDTPFLAHNVGRIGPLELDNYPIVHMKDVLTHEAHRHPYIEQLGVIYLMKLRYTKHFGKRAGTCWRMIFVYALFPWLHKYRIMARYDATTNNPDKNTQEIEDQSSSLQFMSLRNIDTGTFTGDGDDTNQQHTEAMWQMKATATRGMDNFNKRRTLELEEECERLRVSLAEARSLVNRDLEDEVKRLRDALAVATSQPQPAFDEPNKGTQQSLSATVVDDREVDAPSLSDLKPMAPPPVDHAGVPSVDLPNLPGTSPIPSLFLPDAAAGV